MSDFQLKYKRADDELWKKGLLIRGNLFLDALNAPYSYILRTLRVRQIYYADPLAQWLRSFCFVFIVMQIPTFYRAIASEQLDLASRSLAFGIAAFFMSAFGVAFMRWQSKRKNLSRWEDL